MWGKTEIISFKGKRWRIIVNKIYGIFNRIAKFYQDLYIDERLVTRCDSSIENIDNNNG